MNLVRYTLSIVAVSCIGAACSQARDEQRSSRVTTVAAALASSDWPAETLVATNSIELRDRARVAGNVAVTRASPGPVLAANAELALGFDAIVQGSVRVDTLSLRDRARITGNAQFNGRLGTGAIGGSVSSPLPLPLPLTLPVLPSFNVGTQNVLLTHSQSRTLAPGNFAGVTLQSGNGGVATRLTLSGGVYNLVSLTLENDARVECAAACEVRVRDRLTTGHRVFIGPREQTGLGPAHVQLLVKGSNSSSQPSSQPSAALIDHDSTLRAFVLAPNGTVRLGDRVSAEGKIVARDILLGELGTSGGTCGTSDATCNGIDDDCDGSVDEDYVPKCSGASRVTCLNGAEVSTACGDGNACNGNEACSNGTCIPGTPPSIDDGNPCTADTCSATAGVTHTPLPPGTACSNGDACDGVETCNNEGSCQLGAAVVCAAPDQCHFAGTCDPLTGECSNPPKVAPTPCDDGNACTIDDVCVSGLCRPGALVPVDDGNACTADGCDPVSGVTHTPLPRMTPCSDGDACNGLEQCDGFGVCQGGQSPSLDDGNPCTTDVCDADEGVTHEPLPDGTVCDTGNICEGLPRRSCRNAVCSVQDGIILPNDADGYRYKVYSYGGVPEAFGMLAFDDSDFAIGGAPFSSGGGCPIQSRRKTTWPLGTEIVLRRHLNLPPGATNLKIRVAIDNDIEILFNEVNVTGGLQSHEGCADSNQFVFAIPNEVLKEGDNLIAARGRDRGAESGLDIAITGEIPRGTPPVLDDGNPCTIDACDAITGITHAPVVDGTSCSDGNYCNGVEACAGGACRPGEAPPPPPPSPPIPDQFTVLHAVATGVDSESSPAIRAVLDDRIGPTRTLIDFNGASALSLAPGDRDARFAAAGVIFEGIVGNTQIGGTSDGRGISGDHLTVSPGFAPSRVRVEFVDPGSGARRLVSRFGAFTTSEDVSNCMEFFGPEDESLGFACNEGPFYRPFDKVEFLGARSSIGIGAVEIFSDSPAVPIPPGVEPDCQTNCPYEVDLMVIDSTPPAHAPDGRCSVPVCDPVKGWSFVPAPEGTSCDDETVCNGREACDGAGSCLTGIPPQLTDGNACTTDSCDPIAGVSHVPSPGITCERCGSPGVCDEDAACVCAKTCSADRFATKILAHSRVPTNVTAEALVGAHDGVPAAFDNDGDSPGFVLVELGSTAIDQTGPDFAVYLNDYFAGEPEPFQLFGSSDGVSFGSLGTFSGTQPTPAPLRLDLDLAGSGLPALRQLRIVNRLIDPAHEHEGPDIDAIEVLNCGDTTCASGADDGNPCTVDACDEQGVISHSPADDGTPCADGDVCNGAEVCAAGVCEAGTPPIIDDGDPCTEDTCDPITGVNHDAPGEIIFQDDFSPQQSGWSFQSPSNDFLGELNNNVNVSGVELSVPSTTGHDATIEFDLIAVRTLDDTSPCCSCCTDVLTFSVNGQQAFTGSPSGERAGFTSNPSGATMSAPTTVAAGVSRRISVPVRLLAGTNQFTWTFSPLQSLADEAWGLDNVVVRVAGECTPGTNQPPVVDAGPARTIDTSDQMAWSRATPAGTPNGRYGSIFAYDDVRDRLTIVHGAYQGARQSDAWVVENATASRGDVHFAPLATPNGPAPRAATGAFGYDQAANQLVVFGGCAGVCQPVLSEVWLLTNANGLGGPAQWIRQPDAPIVRQYPSGTYLQRAKKLLVFGGDLGREGTPTNEVWLLSGASPSAQTEWTKLEPTGTPPEPRLGAAIAFDEVSRRLIVASGTDSINRRNFFYDDVWVLTNADGVGQPEWIQLNPTGPRPEGRHAGWLAYDTSSNRAYLVSGGRDTTTSEGVWMLTNANGLGGVPSWQKLPSQGCDAPPGLYWPAIGFSAATQRLVMTGGDNGALSPSTRSETWILQGLDRASGPSSRLVNLEGSVSDDGLPGGALTSLWSQESGTPATIVDPNAAVASVPLCAPGDYVFELSASDGELTASDKTTISVQRNEPNRAPVVSAGPDIAVVASTSVVLSGRVVDDGLPAPGLTEASWSMISGPQAPTFGDASSASTTVTFEGPGVYVLRLSATDGVLTSTDELTVTLAGADFVPVPDVIGLPLNSATTDINVAGLQVGAVTESVDGGFRLVFDVLPSRRGWGYRATNSGADSMPPEEGVFSVSSGLLRMNSLSAPQGGGCSNLYVRVGDVRNDAAWTYRVRARILEEIRIDPNNSFGFSFGAGSPQAECGIGIGIQRIQDASNRLLAADLDTTVFHDYELVCDPVSGSYRFSIDGAFVAEQSVRTDIGLNRIYFGDGTCGANARGEFERVEFEQPVVVTEMPVAGTLVAPNSTVDLDLQSGPATQLVPELRGLTRAEAEDAIAEARLGVGRVTMRSSADVPAGSVIDQQPLPDSRAVPGESVGLFISKGSMLCAPAPEGLRAWLRADQTLRDEVSGSLAMTTGGVTFAPGLSGESWLLDRGAVSLPHSPALVFDGALTVETWIRPNAWISVPFSKMGGNGAGDFGLSYYADTERFTFFVSPASGGAYVNVSTPNGSARLGDWVHFAATVSPSATRVYLDGAEVASGPGVVAGTNTGPLVLGAFTRGGSLDQWFGGNLDEFSVYGRALSAAEIASIYAADTAGKCPLAAPRSCDLEAEVPSEPLRVAVGPGSWASASDMTSLHPLYATATALSSGDVLVAGGWLGSVATAAVDLYSPGASGWTAMPPMETPRYLHTATLLDGGSVLVAGGWSGGALTSVQIFDGDTRAWRAASAMPIARDAHVAVRLPNGRVFLAGGENGTGYLASTSTYDPISNSWVVSAPMTVPRAFATATLLPNGRVLLAGGRNASGSVASAEIYDPASNSWAPAGALSGARYLHSAVLVGGKVLVAGGSSGSNTLDTTELFDPITSSWSDGGRLSAPRAEHASLVLADGRALVLGGGLGTEASATRVAETFDPVSGRWSQVAWARNAHRSPVAALLHNGDVLLAGGRGGSKASEIYRPRVTGWKPAAPMKVRRHDFATVLLRDGRVFVAGGFEGPGGRVAPTAAAEIYDPDEDRWTSVPDMSTPRARGRAALLPDGRVLVAGGIAVWDAPYTTLDSAEIFDPATNVWQPAEPMAAPRYVHALTALCEQNAVLATGGWNGSPNAVNLESKPSAELFSAAMNDWQTINPMIDVRSHHSATLLADGRVLVAGGTAGGTGRAEVFDPVAGTWTATPALQGARFKHRAVRLPDGRVLIAGGFDAGGSAINRVEIFDPLTNGWTITAPLQTARVELALGLLDSTHVLAAGGWDDGSSEIYDVASASWSPAPAMNAAHGEAGSARLLDGRVLVAGGLDVSDATVATSEIFQPALDSGIRAPTTHDDTYVVSASSLHVPSPGVLANDLDLDAAPFIELARVPLHGSVEIESNGAFTYIPNLSFAGADSFAYRVRRGDLHSNVAVVSLTGTPPTTNQPPIVSAGAAQTIKLPNTAILAGTALDDGLPTGSTLQCTWSRASGPDVVSLLSPNSLSTTAAFPTPGTYVMRLTCTDGELNASSDVSVTVNPPDPGPNQAPTVVCNDDLVLRLPDDRITLTCAVIDDGRPEIGFIAAGWSIEGPSPDGAEDLEQTFDGLTATLTARLPLVGDYTFTLIATDSELEGRGQVQVKLLPPNQAPLVSAGPDLAAPLDQPDGTATFTLSGSVTDDGVPEVGALSHVWSHIDGPVGCAIQDPTALTTIVTCPALGEHTFELSASDGQLTSADRLVVTVEPFRPNLPPVTNAGPDLEIQLPANVVTLAGQVDDDGLPAGAPLTVHWEVVSCPGAPVFLSPSNPTTKVSFSAPGKCRFRLVASDLQYTPSDEVDVMVWAAPGGAGPEVEIAVPGDSVSVTGPTDVVGSVTDTDNNLFDWYLERRPIDGSTWTRFATGTGPVTSATLGSFDPTLLLNGIYEIRLTARDLARNFVSMTTTVVVEGNQKVGNFTVSFKDISVPVAGIPIEVIRTYDSRNKEKGDFGVGWTLDIASLRVQKNRVIGATWETSVEQAGPFGIVQAFCLIPSKRHYVTVTFADGKVFRWEAKVVAPGAGWNDRRECQLGSEFVEAQVEFLPLAPTTATLARRGGNGVIIEAAWPGEAELIATDGSSLFDPDEFVVTLHDGRELAVGSAGLEQITDTNGNVLEIRSNGLFHSTGSSILFARDGEGRITSITDPEGKSLAYAYDSAGDLATFTDREAATTTYAYDGAHFLLGIIDARGIQPLRNEYDPAGRLLSNTDAFGKTITYEHQIAARKEIITDRLGNVTTHEYDDRGNVLTTTDALGNATTYVYDDRDNKVSECNPLGECSTFTYDDFDNKRTETDPLLNVTHYDYDGRGNVTQVTDPLGRITTSEYDDASNLKKTIDAAGGITEYTYDSRGLQLTMKDPLGHTTISTYDPSGNLLTDTDAAGHLTSYTYDANGNRLTQTTTRTTDSGVETLITTFTYDAQGRLISTKAPDGATTSTEYDEVGQVTANIDGRGNRTEREYDAMGRLVKVTYADGTFETTEYDAEGHRIGSTDRALRPTTFSYDAVGRLVATTFPDGAATSTTYDEAGRTLTTTDEEGNVTTEDYDAAGRRVKTTDPLGHSTSSSYDEAGNQLSTTDPLGHTTSYLYDDLNRRTEVHFDDGTIERTEYDPLGRRTAKIDPAGVRTEYVYDPLDRLVKVTDALGGITTYAYDELGNQTSQIDALGHQTTFAYDRAGRRTRRTLPSVAGAPGAFETMTYDQAGNLDSKTDFAGRTTHFTYDGVNRLTEKSYPDASVITFSYTPSGRRARVTDARGPTSYTYDARDRVTSMTYPDGRSLSYGYDLRGNRASLTANVAGSSFTTSYRYDDNGRLIGVTDPQDKTYSYEYDAAGRRTSLSQPNGTVTTYRYDTVNHLTHLETKHTPTGATIQSYAYTLGATGIRTRIDEAGGVARVYAYDDLYRLTNEMVTGTAGLDYTKTFRYDAVGNRLAQTTTGYNAADVGYTYDERDRLLTENGTSYGWDVNGNMTIRAGDAEYTWDYEDRLVRVTKADGTAVEHAYDAGGVRVRTRIAPPGGQAPEVTNYLVDTAGALSHVIAETDGAGDLAAVYVRGGDQLLAVQREATARYYAQDGLGSVRKLTDEGGTLTSAYGYTAFGEALEWGGSDGQPYRFAGEEWEELDQAYYLRSRYLHINEGRFLAADRLGQLPGLEDAILPFDYIYADNQPASATDPTGYLSPIGFLSARDRLLAGGIVHNFIGQDFAVQGATRVHNYVAVEEIIKRLSPSAQCAGWTASCRDKPDLTDFGNGEVFEIKTRRTGLRQGNFVLRAYIGALNFNKALNNIPGSLFRRGTSYTPPQGPQEVAGLPTGTVVVIDAPVQGVILYELKRSNRKRERSKVPYENYNLLPTLAPTLLFSFSI